tara:strand:+ start:2538 stop:3539 length:1002 start_codon:yes stop_codon:yes gene_type:complete
MTECLIIGAGIVGLSTAYELKKQGYKVTVIDGDKIGKSSQSAAGILFPLSPWENSKYMQNLCISGHNEYNIFYKNLNLQDKKKISFEKKNLIIFGKNINLARNWYKKNNFVDSNYYDNKLNLIEKNIKEVYKNYLVVKNINILNPLSLINFYKEKLKNLGVIFKKDNIYHIHDFVDFPENHIYDFIIVTAGSWSNEIINKKDIKIKPIKGQLLHFKTKEKLINNIILFDDYYIMQRHNNNIIVGATIEDVGFNSNITKEAKNYLKEAISRIFLKAIYIGELTHTFGFRPYSINDKPYINIDSINNRIIYNFGHYRYGILTSIASAKMVKNLIT